MHEGSTSRPDALPQWLQQLLHRWFVRYNPIYFISAASVLVGVYFLSAAVARRSNVEAELTLSVLTETYQLSLIGAAALLYRLRQRRPAVMLALLAMVYLLDVTLQTSVAPHLGTAGLWVSAGWLALFGLKVAALSWALRLELSRRTFFTLGLGATGLALFPQLLYGHLLQGAHAVVAVTVWLTLLGILGGWRRLDVSPKDRPSPEYGPIVARLVRAVFGAGIWVHAASCSQLALLPRSSLGWGVGLVAGGFFALIVGVVINVWLARRALAPGAVPGEPPTP